MLNKVVLKTQLQSGLEDILPGAFAEAYREMFPQQTEAGTELANQFGDTLSLLLSGPVASLLSEAIDFYIKNASLQGTIMTTGSPVAQTAIVMPAATPLVAGVIPNTLKVL